MQDDNKTKIHPATATAVYVLSKIYAQFGTVTDVSVFAQIQDPYQMMAGQVISDDVLEAVAMAAEQRLVFNARDPKNEPLDFNKDGRKILAFCHLYKAQQIDAATESIETANRETHEMLRRLCLRYLVTLGEDGAKRAAVDFLNFEFTEADADWLRQNGCGFVLKMEPDKQEENREMARAYVDARDNMQEHLTALWLELFKDKGVEGAVAYMRDFWKPTDDKARNAINAAYVAAKKLLK